MKIGLYTLFQVLYCAAELVHVSSGKPVNQIAIQANEEATRIALKDPVRCSLFQKLHLIENDTEAHYLRLTGQKLPTGPYKCSKCSMLFDSITQGVFHHC